MLRVLEQMESLSVSAPNLQSRRPILVVGLLLMLTALPYPAMAHDGTGLAGGVAAGLSHPLSGFDHMLAMVAVGIWGSFLGRPLIYALPILFPSAMALGGGLGMAGVPIPPVELGIALSVVMLGAMILFALRLPVVPAVAIVAIFALFHGYAHGMELPSAADPIGYSAGFVLCTGLLHLAGIGLGTVRASRAGTLALRSVGGAMAMAGIWFTVWAVAA